MVIIAGLGNPGSRYTKTRHNFGFWVVDAMSAHLTGDFKPGKGDYLYAGNEDSPYLLMKPISFMNNSGFPVKEALGHFDASPEELLVVYDDLDLPLGEIRFRKQGSSGGHKGMASVIYHLETDQIHRLRLGIATDAMTRPSEEYVLDVFRDKDWPTVERVIDYAIEGIETYLESGIDTVMTKYNRRQPSEPGGSEGS